MQRRPAFLWERDVSGIRSFTKTEPFVFIACDINRISTRRAFLIHSLSTAENEAPSGTKALIYPIHSPYYYCYL